MTTTEKIRQELIDQRELMRGNYDRSVTKAMTYKGSRHTLIKDRRPRKYGFQARINRELEGRIAELTKQINSLK